MTVCVALGLNVWILAVALPFGLMWRAHVDDAALGGVVASAALAVAALLALAVGAWRRSTLAMMVLFPLVVALPQALIQEPAATRYCPPAALVLLAASLIGYLVAVSRLFARRDHRAGKVTATVRPLSQEPTPPRWRRRLRVYRLLTITAIAYPAALLAGLDLRPSLRADLAETFGAAAARAQALGTVAIGLLWVILYRSYLVAPMEAHLQHDRDLMAAMEVDRRHARRGRPRAAFYFAVALALAAMAGVVWQRTR